MRYRRWFWMCHDGLRRWRLFMGRNHDTVLEFCLFPTREASLGYSLRVDNGDDHPVTVSLHLPFLGYVYLCFGGRVACAIARRVPEGEHECRLGAVWPRAGRGEWRFDLRFSAWSRIMEWRSADPWWRKSHTVDFADLLFGRRTMERRDLVTVERTVLIPAHGDYPERNHRLTVTVNHCSWGRPRSPFAPHRLVCTDTTLHEMAPFPGKGTCDYNCGEDGLNGQWAPHELVDPDRALLGERDVLDVAIGLACRRVVDTVMERRRHPHGD